MLAKELIRAVEQAGGRLELDGDGIVVEAPMQLSEPIMTELRAHKAEVLVALAGRTARTSSGNSGRARLAIVPNLSIPEDIRTWLDERAAMREDSGTPRVDADKAAFDELLWLWSAANPVEHAPGRCAACAISLGAAVMSLPDGAQVCDKPGHACLISYGNGRRMEAVGALNSLGIAPPMWWTL
jgi:hypothetical protein